MVVSKPTRLFLPFRKYLENREASLAMRLPPFLALGVPELDRCQSCPCHGQIRGVEDITRLAVDISRAIAKTENLKGRELAASHGLDMITAEIILPNIPQVHGDEFGSAFLAHGESGVI